MDYLTVLFGILIIFCSWVNLNHFAKKRRIKKKEAQIHLIILFVFFVLAGFNFVMVGITENENLWITFGIANILITFLFTSGLAITEMYKLARSVGLLAIVFNLVNSALGMAHVYGELDISILTITAGLSLITTIIALTVLGILLKKTRLSPIAGLFYGVLVMLISAIFTILIPVIPNEVNMLVFIIMEIVIYIGFLGKLKKDQ